MQQPEPEQIIELIKLVKRPQTFDGNKPPARQWLDDFEKRSEANGWQDSSMVKLLLRRYDWRPSLTL